MNSWYFLSYILKWVVVDNVGSWVSAGHAVVFDSTLLNPLIQEWLSLFIRMCMFYVSTTKSDEITRFPGLLFEV